VGGGGGYKTKHAPINICARWLRIVVWWWLSQHTTWSKVEVGNLSFSSLHWFDVRCSNVYGQVAMCDIHTAPPQAPHIAVLLHFNAQPRLPHRSQHSLALWLLLATVLLQKWSATPLLVSIPFPIDLQCCGGSVQGKWQGLWWRCSSPTSLYSYFQSISASTVNSVVLASVYYLTLTLTLTLTSPLAMLTQLF
jgi:hypothetical protein